jgi:hypothetical protein
MSFLVFDFFSNEVLHSGADRHPPFVLQAGIVKKMERGEQYGLTNSKLMLSF